MSGAGRKTAIGASRGSRERMTCASLQGCECLIEVEGRRGRTRIEWKGPVAPVRFLKSVGMAILGASQVAMAELQGRGREN